MEKTEDNNRKNRNQKRKNGKRKNESSRKRRQKRGTEDEKTAKATGKGSGMDEGKAGSQNDLEGNKTR